MSFGGKARLPSSEPKTAGVDGDDFSTNQEAVPLRWFSGVEWCPLTWISDVHNPKRLEIREEVGKSSTTVGHDIYSDVAGVACFGLVDRVLAIEVDGEEVWTGSRARPTSGGDPEYNRADISTDAGRFYIYWGRSDQPEDTILLKPLGDTNSAYRHPAYRHQCYAVIKGLFHGRDREQPPSVRLLLGRIGKPAIGTFAAEAHAQGEGIVPFILELLTDPISGAGIDTSRFTAGDWETLHSAVKASVGRHAPSLSRERPVRDIVQDLLRYFDGWMRIQGAGLEIGQYPHDGTVPGGLTELSHHDFTEHPRIDVTPVEANVVTVKFRDRARRLKEDSITVTAGGSIDASAELIEKIMELPGIVDEQQAAEWAAEAVVIASNTYRTGLQPVRRAKAVWSGGDPLEPGDVFQFDYTPATLDLVARIIAKIETFRGEISLDWRQEPGVWPLPYQPPANARPSLGSATPEEIDEWRLWELPSSLGGREGVPVAFLAMRPAATYPGGGGISAESVVGFSVHVSPSGSSYDVLGSQTKWAARATLRSNISAGTSDPTVEVTVDADNLDLDRYVEQSDDAQADDSLLLVIGDEIFTVGAITIASNDWDLTTKRARQGTEAVAHAVNDEGWLIYRDEITVYRHAEWAASVSRWFKLQPWTHAERLALSSVTAEEITFVDRTPERPSITLNAISSSPPLDKVVSITGSITDVNGDLERVEVVAQDQISGEEIILLAEETRSGASYTIATSWLPKAVSTWRIVVRAWDSRGKSEVDSGNLGVGSSPPAITWTDPSSTPSTATTGSPVTFSGTISDADSDLASYSLTWRPAGGNVETTVASKPLTGANYAFEHEITFGTAGSYIVTLQAQDRVGRVITSTRTIDVDVAGGTVATPVVTPDDYYYPPGAFPVTVTITCATAGATIEYQITDVDGEPGAWSTYTGAIMVSADEMVWARATKAGMDDSGWMVIPYFEDTGGLPY